MSAATWQALNTDRLAKVHPVLCERIQKFIDEAAGRGISVLVTQGLRTWEEQAKLYDQGRTLPGKIVTKAPPGFSWHNFGLAVDVVPDNIQDPGLQLDWNEAHPVWKQILGIAKPYQLAEGAEWRSFPDFPHLQPFELMASPDTKIRMTFHDKGLAGVWSWFAELLRGAS